MWAVIKDITIDKYITVDLPMDLNTIINPHHEYIFTDWSVLPLYEYTSITEVNEFLLFCKEIGINEETLEILSRVCTFSEVKDAIESGNYDIVDFDFVTSNWMVSDINDDWDKGRVLFEEGYVTLPFEYKEEYEEYIRWETLWTEAETGHGWKVARTRKYHDYLVRV